MIGTLINAAAIIVGGFLGLYFGSRLPEQMRKTIMIGLGLFTLVIGVQMFLLTKNAIVVLIAIIFGIVLGEWWQLEAKLHTLALALERRFGGVKEGEDNRFVKGFLSASLVFCIGPMAILGAIQDGLTGNYQTLMVKSILDFFGAMAFSALLGVGVLFSSVVTLIFQGGISLLAGQVQTFVTPAMQNEMAATGGVILVAIALGGILEIKPIRAGNFLPAIFLAPVAVWIFGLFHL
jgi:uncharacterized membrane protein YqgA involved in biofilm formation